MHDAPLPVFPVIELCLPALRMKRAPILAHLGYEVPLELRPGRVPVHMNGDVLRRELAFRERRAHQVPIDIGLDLLEAVLLAARVNERDLRRI